MQKKSFRQSRKRLQKNINTAEDLNEFRQTPANP
jgi:hypothetical protein